MPALYIGAGIVRSYSVLHCTCSTPSFAYGLDEWLGDLLFRLGGKLASVTRYGGTVTVITLEQEMGCANMRPCLKFRFGAAR